MKLGKTVTYPSLESMSLCGSVPVQSACAQWFWWESWIWRGHRPRLLPGSTGRATLVGDRAGAGGAGLRAWCRLGWSDRAARAPGSFQSAASAETGSKQVCAYSLSSRVESWFPTAHWLAPLVSKPARGACLPSAGPQARVLMWASNPSLFREDPWACDIPVLYWVTHQGRGSN